MYLRHHHTQRFRCSVDSARVTVAAAVARSVVAALGGGSPELLVDVHAIDQHGSRGSSGAARLEGCVGNIGRSVVDHATGDLLTEVGIFARVHEERVPADVDLGRRRQSAVGGHGRDLEERERLLHNPLGPIALGRLVLIAEELLELQILDDAVDETVPELRTDERLVGRRSDRGGRGDHEIVLSLCRGGSHCGCEPTGVGSLMSY